MPSIKPTCIRDLKFRVNIVDVVSRVATLKKAGSRFKGLCPFHNEKTPSFHVDPDKGFYKCFGCGKAGDIISFVRETEQLSFSEAIETLGKRYGVAIEYEEGTGPTHEERTLRQELFDLHDAAAEHFHETFKETAAGSTGEWMQAFWKNARRFPLELADEFKIGAAHANDNSLGALLLRKKFSEEALRASGLFFINENALLTIGALRPRFRGRLMIPIRDHQGRIVAFTARQTDLTPADDPAREAKYVNSPETPIFTKGNIIFNLDRARTVAGPEHPFVLVEGQLDALRSWSVGVKTAIAFQGTAITDNQLNLLRRYHTQVECLFDSDSAGQKASLRYLPLALKAGLESRFLSLSGSQKIDPDLLFLERGIAAYGDLRKHALSAMQFACRSLLPSPENASAEQKSQATRALFDIILNAESEIARSQFLNEVALDLHLPPQALARDYDAYRKQMAQRIAHHPANTAAAGVSPNSKPQTPNSASSSNTSSAANSTDLPEYHLLLICLHFENLGSPISHLLLAHPEWIDHTHTAGSLLANFLNHFAHDNWPGREHLDEHEILETDAEKTLIATLLFDPPKIDEPVRVANQALTAIRNRNLEPRLRQIELALATHQADSGNDAISLIKERINIQRQLRQPFGLPAAV